MLQTVSITVKGRVQGVYYRQSTREKARELGITGFVQNMPDTTVYIVATGTDEQLEALVTWCKKGPARARVSDVIVASHISQTFDGFTIRR